MKLMLLPLVLAGGVGSRLWPVSRAALPKQFLKFPMLEESLFQAALSRLEGLHSLVDPIVVCNEEHRFLVAEQLREMQLDNNGLLIEPVGRNTAPSVALAAFHALRSGDDPILLVLPADHLIRNAGVLREVILQGEQVALSGSIVTFGIEPTGPETCYGYIEKEESADNSLISGVSRFVEKPGRDKAEQYIQRGNFLWNSGMFMFKASVYLAELERLAPLIYQTCESALESAETSSDFISISKTDFENCPSDSIDYAVMEKTQLAKVISLDAKWSDLGSWDAVWENSNKDNNGNVLMGDVLVSQVSNTYIEAQTKLVAAVGVENAIIVETADSLLIADKGELQRLKPLVEQLKAAGRVETQTHALVRRPWGTYESIAMGAGYQVKHIVVNPGASLSLQLHHHRAEHWMVLKGIATVTVGESTFALNEEEATFIPLGEKHRLENQSDEFVEIIEVQMGSYLGEDDIVRFDDKYGRVDAQNSEVK